MTKLVTQLQVGLSVLLLLALTLAPQGGVHPLVLQPLDPNATLAPAPPTPPRADNTDQYGGYLGLPIDNSSGYFRTAQVDGKWWLVTPDGHAFWSTGVSAIFYALDPSIVGSYSYFNPRQYANPQQWADTASGRLLSWGFNTLGSWADPMLEGRGLVTTRILGLSGGDFPRANPGLADVFDPTFARVVNDEVKANISEADISNPWLLGYFLDNELWWYHDGVYRPEPRPSVVENYIALPRTAAGKQAWVNSLRARYASIDALNKAWGTGYTSFNGEEDSSLLNVTQVTAALADDDKDKFLFQLASEYYRITSSAIRARDPHHLLLGDRHLPPPQLKPVIDAAAQYMDVQSINVYNSRFNHFIPELNWADQIGSWSNKPVLITEYDVRGTDSGLPNGFRNPGPPVPSQDARADAYRIFINQLLKRPYVVGAHWFPYADDPAVGSRPDQNNNWGLVDATDQPYAALVLRLADYNRNIYPLRLGQTTALPIPRYPAYNDSLFVTNPTFNWEGDADSYRVQVARRPDFRDARSYQVNATSFAPPDELAAGRWYWRVRATSGGDDYLAYTSAWPFYVYKVVNSLSLADFEGDAAANWRADPPGSINLSPSSDGVTEGGQSLRLDYTGKADYATSGANLYRLPEGGAFQPRDWSGYDFLALDVTRPNADYTVPVPVVGISNDDGSKSYNWRVWLRAGTEHAAMRVADAAAALDLHQVGHLRFGYGFPPAGITLYLDNLRLIQVSHDSAAQPAIGPVAADAHSSGTVELDWSGYQPAATTVGYNIYVSDHPFAASDALLPVQYVDATVMHARVKLATGLASGNLQPLSNGVGYYFAVRAVDAWGNIGPLGQLAQATPTATEQFATAPLSQLIESVIAHREQRRAEIAVHERLLRILVRVIAVGQLRGERQARVI